MPPLTASKSWEKKARLKETHDKSERTAPKIKIPLNKKR